MITHYFRTVKDERMKEIYDVRTGIWTHVVAPQEAEIEQLVKDFGLDRSIVADAQDLFEVPRFERSGSAAYFFVRYPFNDSQVSIDTAPMLVVVGESFVITIAQKKVPFLDVLIESGQVFTTQKTNLFIQIMTTLTQSFDTELVRMRRSVHKDRVRLQRIGTKDIARLVGYEHALNEAIAAIVPTNAWLQQLTSGHHMQLFSNDVALMEDLMIANSQLVDSSKMLLKTIQNIRSANEAILTQNLNNTIKVLTALTVIFTVPTVISSLYGMNVALPLANNPNAFWALLVVIAASVGIITYYFAQKNWF
jgi:magnesium transporter